MGLVGIVVIRADAPELADGLAGRGLALVQLSGVAGIGARTPHAGQRHGAGSG